MHIAFFRRKTKLVRLLILDQKFFKKFTMRMLYCFGFIEANKTATVLLKNDDVWWRQITDPVPLIPCWTIGVYHNLTIVNCYFLFKLQSRWNELWLVFVLPHKRQVKEQNNKEQHVFITSANIAVQTNKVVVKINLIFYSKTTTCVLEFMRLIWKQQRV